MCRGSFWGVGLFVMHRGWQAEGLSASCGRMVFTCTFVRFARSPFTQQHRRCILRSSAKNIREWLIRSSNNLRVCVIHPFSVRATVVAIADMAGLTGPASREGVQGATTHSPRG
jgi:hypothetical protein